jgi:D-glycero-D-manno-heptose 1,7-bisphosphate phosphatase
MKLVILDRDGVINHDSDNYIKSPDEWVPIPGSLDAIARLHQSGFQIAVATNQSGIARGFFDIATLNAMHNKMHLLVTQSGGYIDGIFYCPHGPSDNCHCRKPLPGLLLQIARRFSANLDEVYFVGDSQSDIQAARNAGARPVLVRTGKGSKTESKLKADDNIPVFDDLSAFSVYLTKMDT